jgi:AMP-polyphosphate phosphotransferase
MPQLYLAAYNWNSHRPCHPPKPAEPLAMFELLDFDERIAKDDYKKVFPDLQQRLGGCQRACRAAHVPVVVLVEGWDAAGKGTLINSLTQALDPRGFQVHVIGAANQIEAAQPWMWRYWRAQPAAGVWALFDHSWYRRVLVERLEEHIATDQWQAAYSDILQFEQELSNAGAVLIKLWLHISKREQKRRYARLLKSPAIAWRVGKPERRQHRHYAQWLEAAEEMIARTSTAAAPWTIVEATQRRFARVKTFQTILDAVEQALAARQETKPQAATPPPTLAPLPQKSILDRVDLSLSRDREEYKRELDKLHKRLFKAEYELYLAKVPAVIVYEGWDAAGKGGNIKRLTAGLDPRGYEVVPVAAPSDEEQAHHYLWRFWRRVLPRGFITIFDRSWYGRVLVERVEGFCTESEWKRAYSEINAFERQLSDFGAVLIKFWLQIDAQEQLRRFQERQQSAYKQWKLTDEDWRNRDKRPQYEPAVVEMLERTSTPRAPWTILESNCKLYARIKALRTVSKVLEAAVSAK